MGLVAHQNNETIQKEGFMKHALIGALVLTLATPMAAMAEDSDQPVKLNMAPGLWRTSMNMDGGLDRKAQEQMEAMQKQLQNMPPEQRKIMEQVMAQSGVSLDDGALVIKKGQSQTRIKDNTVTNQNCVTQTQIDTGTWTAMDGCALKLTPLGKDHFKAEQTCDNKMGSMQAEIKFDSPKSFHGSGTTTHQFKGKQETIDIEMKGEWLGADCNAKPSGQSKPQTSSAS